MYKSIITTLLLLFLGLESYTQSTAVPLSGDGWYRIVTGSHPYASGKIKIFGGLGNNKITSITFYVSMMGYNQKGSITILENLYYNNNHINEIRIGTTTSGNSAVDVHFVSIGNVNASVEIDGQNLHVDTSPEKNPNPQTNPCLISGKVLGFSSNVRNIYFGDKVGIGTSNPGAKLHILQDEDPNDDKGLIISEPNNSQSIYLHLADNAGGEYGYFKLGNETVFRGNGHLSYLKGSLGLGTTNTFGYKLAVNGTIGAKEVKVENSSPWPDYVFSSDYNLQSLSELDTYIQQNHHLPNIPSAEEVKEEGIALGEMNAKLLEKIEELTLYIIEQNKESQKLKASSLKQLSKIEELTLHQIEMMKLIKAQQNQIDDLKNN